MGVSSGLAGIFFALSIGSTASAAPTFTANGQKDGSVLIGECQSDKYASKRFAALQSFMDCCFGLDRTGFSFDGEFWFLTGMPQIDARVLGKNAQVSSGGFDIALKPSSGASFETETRYPLIRSVETENAIWRGAQSPNFVEAGTIEAKIDPLAFKALGPNFFPVLPAYSDDAALKFSVPFTGSDPIDAPTVPRPASVGVTSSSLPDLEHCESFVASLPRQFGFSQQMADRSKAIVNNLPKKEL